MKLRTLAKIIGGLFALIIVAGLALPMFISADYLKAQLVQQVKAATGRDLVIKGEASLKIFPNIAVTAEEVTLSNPEGFKTPFFVQLKKLETGAALRPLLSKELQITGITLEGAQLNLEENANGKNWEFAKGTPEPNQPVKGADASATSPLKKLQIGDVVLKDSAFTYSKPGAKPMAAKDINLTIKGADGSSALKVDGKMLFQNEAVTLSLTADKMKELIAGKASPVVLSLALPSATVKFNGSAQTQPEIAANGKLDVAIDDLLKLTSWATGKPGAAAPKKISLKTTVAAKGMDNVSLTDLSFSADSISATGKLAANLAGSVPSIRGALAFGELNLDTVTGSAGKSQGPTKASSGQEGWSDEKIDLAVLRSANANLNVTIGTLRSGKLQVADIAANLSLQDGLMKLNLGNASLYGGAAKGTVSVNGNSGVGLGTNLTLNNIEIDPLLTALVGNSRLEGKANVALAVNGAGSSQRAIVSSLAGNGSMKVVDGAFKGINIASFMRDAKKGFMGESTSEKTDFSELSASFTIAQGVVSNSDLNMKSPVLRLGGKGTVSLPAKTVNYRVEPTLVASLKGQGGKDKEGLTIPLVISGPWSGISITPDLAGMLQEGLKDPTKLKENLKDLKGTLKEFNSPKDIGKALLGGGAAKEAAPTAAPATAPAATEAAPATAVPEPQTQKQKKSDALKEGLGGLLNTLQKN